MGLKTQDRNRPITPLISDYTRKSVAAFIEKYPKDVYKRQVCQVDEFVVVQTDCGVSHSGRILQRVDFLAVISDHQFGNCLLYTSIYILKRNKTNSLSNVLIF